MLEKAYQIHTDAMIRWGAHRAGTKSFTRMALIAVNRIQYVAGMHPYGYLPTQEETDAAHAELRLLERINEDTRH